MDAVLAGPLLLGVQNHSLTVLAAAARRSGYSVAMESFGGFRDIDAVCLAVARAKPRVFGLSMQTTETALASATLVEMLRARGYRGLIVVGGHFATLNAHDLIREVQAIDVVVRFAGEAAFLALLRDGLDQDLLLLPGVIARDALGAPRAGAAPILGSFPRSFSSDEGDLPIHLGFGAADLVSSRGCDAHCCYCCVAGISDQAAALGARSERRDVASLADEMAALFHERQVRVFNFMDDNLLPLGPAEARAWALDLSSALSARRVGRIAFSLQLRADVCTQPVVDALVGLGLVRAYVGIDGYTGRQLVALGRHAPADAGENALATLSAAGVFSVCNALVIGPTFDFATVSGEIEGLSRVTGAPVHLLPIDVRAGSTYFERVRRRGLLEGGTLCWRYRFADPRTALMAEALTSLPTRLDEYSVPVALYDLGYNLGVARRLLPTARIDDACAIYADVSARWNADQIRVLRAAAAAAASGRDAVMAFRNLEAPRVQALDDELRAMCFGALRSVERAASLAHGRSVRTHTRGQLISAVALSVAMAACDGRPLRGGTDAAMDAVSDATDAVKVQIPDATDAGHCSNASLVQAKDLQGICCGDGKVEVTFDDAGIATSVRLIDGEDGGARVLACIQNLLARYCYPSFAGSTQPLVSSHCWVA
jgi:hypothetical protein